MCARVAHLPELGLVYHHTYSWKTHPKDLSSSLKAVIEPRDRVTEGHGVCSVFLEGQQTVEEPCASLPSARHVQPYLGKGRLDQ